MNRTIKLFLEVFVENKKPTLSKIKDLWKSIKRTMGKEERVFLSYKGKDYLLRSKLTNQATVIHIWLSPLQGGCWDVSLSIRRNTYEVRRIIYHTSERGQDGEIRPSFSVRSHIKVYYDNGPLARELRKSNSPFARWFSKMVKLGDRTEQPLRRGKTNTYIVNPSWTGFDKIATLRT